MPAAFLGASGWGANSIGGRGGTVIYVTNLNDSGAGSLRTALQSVGARIIIPRVAGTITLASKITISNPYWYYAGQAGPGSGIVVTGIGGIEINAGQGIMRYLKYRGAGADWQNFINMYSYNTCQDIIVDHCSIAYSSIDAISAWFENGQDADDDMKNITFQNLLISQSLDDGGNDEPSAMLIGANVAGTDKIDRVNHISVHNSLFTNIGWNRSPAMRAQYFEAVNNVNYNNRNGHSYFEPGTGKPAIGDWVNNHWLVGPMTIDEARRQLNQEPNTVGGSFDSPLNDIYVAGNYVPSAQVLLTDPDADNWPLVYEHGGPWDASSIDHQRLTRMTLPTYPVPEVPAASILASVLEEAGACRRLNGDGTWTRNRDSVDAEFIRQVEEDDGPAAIDGTPGAIPDTVAGTAYTDTDGDGMPDEWELANGLDPNDPSDGSIIRANGYSNLEHFLNGMQLEQAARLSVGVNLTAKITGEFIIKNEKAIEEFWRGYFADIQSSVSGIAKTIGNGDET